MNNNAQQLNITTLVTNNNNGDDKNDKNIILINNIFNNDININKKKKYEIKKYLGEGIQGSLYMAFDNNNNTYICKQINLNPNLNPNQLTQLTFELNLLKYLSSHKVTREYINPCLEYKIMNNKVLTIFPIFNGYSLYNIKKYLLKMNNTNYYRILFHLIKVILHGLAKIHQHNVAHQNINENSILVSSYKYIEDNKKYDYNSDNIDNNVMRVKFTDFGLGCGVNDKLISNVTYDINRCNNPIKITNSIIKKLSNTEELDIAQKTDIIKLCSIFIHLLLYFENLDLDLSQGYNNTTKRQIKKIITDKFLSKIENYRKNKKYSSDEILLIDTDNEIKRDILEYLNVFNDYVLCEDKNRQSCQNILDKLIIYEKYKNEVF